MTVSWLVIISTCAQDQSANLSQRLGGDSISSMRLVASAQAEQLQLSFIDIFKNPKLADLAKIGSYRQARSTGEGCTTLRASAGRLPPNIKRA
jgi:aryl carrier-like protein